MEAKTQFAIEEELNDKDRRKFTQMVGSLQYLTVTQLDISYAVNQVFQYMVNLTLGH